MSPRPVSPKRPSQPRRGQVTGARIVDSSRPRVTVHGLVGHSKGSQAQTRRPSRRGLG